MGKKSQSLEKIKTSPEFDLEYYLEISGLSRLDQELMEQLENYWQAWKRGLCAYRLDPSLPDGDDGFLLVYLEEAAEHAAQKAFEEAPEHGFAFHNLAITLVMCAAQSVMPELIGACMPMPTPTGEARKKLRKLGLIWSEDGTFNRSYAVFTPYPYRGGCEVCHSCDTCPSSQVMEIKPKV